MDPRDREMKILEDELERDDLTPEERSSIMRDLRDIERDFDEQDQWREYGHERGWA